MKKFFAILALALLAVSGTGYAVTCAYDNVPAATLLVPYWRVSLNGATGAPIPGVAGATDTLVSIINVSTPGVIAHVTVWNKYSKAVLDFNVPLTGKDLAAFSMKDVMNGKLNVNQTQDPTKVTKDACGINLGNNTYLPSVGWGQTQFIRFSHPESSTPGSDAYVSISIYATDAFAVFRNKVWSSLDESGDISTFTSSKGANILDTDNPGCWGGAGGTYTGNLSGYLTIDVVNFCTNYFPSDVQFYNEDAIATAGWSPTYTPNVLIGDVFYVDAAANAGNISGDPAVPVEFDNRLGASTGAKTFFGRYIAAAITACAAEGTAAGCTNGVAPLFQFSGDGREPLGDRYGFRYLADAGNQLQSWLLVWRGDRYAGGAVNLCAWADPANNAGAKGSGLYDADHVISALVFDNDENFFTQPGQGGPSGNQNPTPSQLYIFLESQRINLLSAIDWNPGSYKGGWVDMTLRSQTANPANITFNQAWVGIQHTAPGAFISVGHAVANLNNQFQCAPAITFGNGNTP